MIMDNYEQKYKKALEAVKFLQEVNPSDEGIQNWVKDNFPELKESEDERIRKKVIEVLKLNIKGAESQMQASRGVDRCFEIYACNKVIAWLEKQGEQKPYGQRKECEDCQFNYAGECKGYCALKRNEQKPTDKVKPKFNVGNWIILPLGIIARIDSLNSTDYQVTTTDGKVCDLKISKQDNYRLWSIDDAKRGDVLVDVYGNIGMFDKCYDFDWMSCCSLGNNEGFQYFTVEHENEKTYPATKEQRDLFFQVMADAGYEFVNGHITRF